MLDYKGILNHYREGIKSADEYRECILPFVKFLSYIDTGKEQLEYALTEATKLPDEYGLKELKDKVKEITDFLDEYSGESVVEDMAE